MIEVYTAIITGKCMRDFQIDSILTMTQILHGIGKYQAK
jgi:hypothetical protein